MIFAPGFNLPEALDLVTLCAMIEGHSGLPQPAGWSLVFDSPEIPPFTEKWQLWQNASGAYAIVIRGTVPEPGSIIEDIISFLARAGGSVTIGPYHYDYKFAAGPHASVHAGFALGALLLLKEPANGILAQLAAKVPAGSQIYVTGHSQGAAVGTLLRSYFRYAPDRPERNYSYKTYVFAQPKPGNDHYAQDFQSAFSNPGLAFRVTNSLDWVPQVPFTIEIASDINTPNPLSTLPLLSSMMLKTLTGIGTEARKLIADRVKSHLKAKEIALARVLAPGAAPELLSAGFDIPAAPSLNFANAGAEISLIGTPCSGAECEDAFFEHHASTYFALMKAQL
ncbi:MAG: hypothetical protein L0Y57_05555 [Beijerinckiaceae bacterium]|nr:hypothetical protein [Beijerinckiaceae bacterium]